MDIGRYVVAFRASKKYQIENLATQRRRRSLRPIAEELMFVI